MLKLFLLFSFITSLLIAQPSFPELSGPVVDKASLLSTQEAKVLSQTLRNFEKNSTNQLVLLTLQTLQGYEIEEYAYQLGRHWGIGQKGKDNGVLLIVAPNERKVRIEVGYGLEGVLTDKISFDIIQEKILPAFKNGNYTQGIQSGIKSIINELEGKSISQNENPQTITQYLMNNIIGVIFILVFAFFSLREVISSKKARGIRLYLALIIATIVATLVYFPFHEIVIALVAWVLTFMQIYTFGSSSSSSTLGSSNSYGGGSSSFSDFGGFSGGGGSFGGGGASGSW